MDSRCPKCGYKAAAIPGPFDAYAQATCENRDKYDASKSAPVHQGLFCGTTDKPCPHLRDDFKGTRCILHDEPVERDILDGVVHHLRCWNCRPRKAKLNPAPLPVDEAMATLRDYINDKYPAKTPLAQVYRTILRHITSLDQHVERLEAVIARVQKDRDALLREKAGLPTEEPTSTAATEVK